MKTNPCKCGKEHVWSERFKIWLCVADLVKYEAIYGEKFEL